MTIASTMKSRTIAVHQSLVGDRDMTGTPDVERREGNFKLFCQRLLAAESEQLVILSFPLRELLRQGTSSGRFHSEGNFFDLHISLEHDLSGTMSLLS
jgi:hypothetical protein